MAKNKNNVILIIAIIVVLLFVNQNNQQMAVGEPSQALQYISAPSTAGPNQGTIAVQYEVKNKASDTESVKVEIAIYSKDYADFRGFALATAIPSCGRLDPSCAADAQCEASVQAYEIKDMAPGESYTSSMTIKIPKQGDRLRDGTSNYNHNGQYVIVGGVYQECGAYIDAPFRPATIKDLKIEEGVEPSTQGWKPSLTLNQLDRLEFPRGDYEGWSFKTMFTKAADDSKSPVCIKHSQCDSNNCIRSSASPTAQLRFKVYDYFGRAFSAFDRFWLKDDILTVGVCLKEDLNEVDFLDSGEGVIPSLSWDDLKDMTYDMARDSACRRDSDCGGNNCVSLDSLDRKEAGFKDRFTTFWKLDKPGLCMEPEKAFEDWVVSWAPDWFGSRYTTGLAILGASSLVLFLVIMGMTQPPQSYKVRRR